MSPILLRIIAVAALAVVPVMSPASAQTAAGDKAAEAAEGPPAPPAEPPPPVYEDQILRLAEILGSLHLLRALCGDGDADVWKREMEDILAAESPGPLRRARLIGRFNHGFETFNATSRSCTPSARRSIRRYLSEGRLLSGDVQARYGQ